MKSYRVLKIRRPLSQFPEEERRALIEVLKRAEALGNLWSRGYEVTPPGMEYFAREFKWFKEEIVKQGRSKRWLRRIHAVFSCQIRLDNERDIGRGVFVDLPKGELRIRGIIKGRAIVIKLKEKEVGYIRQRLEEGAVLTFARVWTDERHLYIALTFRREVEQYRPKALVAVDVNALHHGVAVGLVDGELKEVRKFEAPVNKIYFALGQARIWSAAKTRNARRREKKLWRRAYNLVRHFVNRTARGIVELALSNQAEIWVDTPFDKSVRELYRKMPRAEKMLLAGMRRLARRVEELAMWHGVPVRRVVLYSTRCPVCNTKLEELNGRMMRCKTCGFSAERDYVPLYWARRLWAERRAQPPSFSSPILIARQLYA